MKIFFILIVFLGTICNLHAQGGSSDAVALKNNKKALAIRTEIHQYQLKIANETNELNKLKRNYPKLQYAAENAVYESKQLSTSVSAGNNKSATKALKATKIAEDRNNKVSKNVDLQNKSSKKIYKYKRNIEKLESKLHGLDR